MPNTKRILQSIEDWKNWLIGCADQPIAAPACRPLWEGVMVAAAVTGAWLLLWVVWKAIQHHLQYNAAIWAQMERERIAEPAVMEEHRFKEAGDLAADATDPHLAQKIRDELERQKRARVERRAS